MGYKRQTELISSGQSEKFKFFKVCIFPLNFLELFFFSTWRLVPLVEIPSFFEIFSCFIMLKLGLRFGTIGLDCLAFLFLPVARGSVLLRLIDIPFEQATRYHVWLGHLTMLLFTLHGLFYAIAWTIEGHILDEVSANGVILFLVHSHIMWEEGVRIYGTPGVHNNFPHMYTYVFLFSLYIYIYIYKIYSSFGKQTNIYIYIYTHILAKRMQ